MQINFLLALIILACSCGRNVHISTSNLESHAFVSESAILESMSEGVLNRRDQTTQINQIKFNGKDYTVSRYSSYLALTYIDSRPTLSSTNVRFKGKTDKGEIFLENIQTK